MNIMRRLTVGIVVATLVCFGAASSGRAAEPPVLLTVEIRGISALIGDVNRLAMAMQLGPQGALLMPTLDRALGGGGFSGIDTNGVVCAYVFGRDPEATPTLNKPVVVALPTHDNGHAFMDGLTNRFERGASDGGVVRFSQRSSEMSPRSDLHVGTEGGFAILGENRALVDDVMRRIGSGQLQPGARIDVPGTLAMSVNLPAIGIMLQNTLGKTADSMPAAPGAGPNRADILKTEGNVLKAFIDQIETFEIGLGTDSRSVVMQTRSVAKADTVVGRVYQDTRPPRRDFLSVLPDGLLLAQVGHMGAVDEFLDMYSGMLTQIMGSLGGETQGLSELMRQSMGEMRGLATGDYAMGVWAKHNPSGVGYVYYLGVKDPARAKTVFDRYAERFAATNSAVAGMQFRAERGASREHNGVPISAYRYLLTLGPDAQDAPLGAPSFLSQWTNMLYEVAFAGDVCVLTMGDQGQMDAALDRLQAPGGSILDSKMFQGLFPSEPAAGQAVQVANLSLVEYAKMILGMLPGVNTQMLEMFPATQSGLSGYAIAEGLSQRGVVKIGMDEIVALKSMVPFVMMSAMSAGGGPGRGPMGGMPSPSSLPEEPEQPAAPVE
ncbi:MAG: hypothetical protein K8T26_10355 [Lentisphaerae bacterium]|nr:hypothetical protein [Lentisphaerota bacterium]